MPITVASSTVMSSQRTSCWTSTSASCSVTLASPCLLPRLNCSVRKRELAPRCIYLLSNCKENLRSPVISIPSALSPTNGSAANSLSKGTTGHLSTSICILLLCPYGKSAQSYLLPLKAWYSEHWQRTHSSAL